MTITLLTIFKFESQLMSSHSTFKKFNILHELEQAIKKKTQEKYAPNRSKSRTKPSENVIKTTAIKSPVAQKQLTSVQGRKTATITNKASKVPQFKIKKHQNKKFDKIISLINYTITSADKALKYVNLSSNFEAEFAYKLYISDRENLMNQLNNLNLPQLLGQNSSLGLNNVLEMKGIRNQQMSTFGESNLLKQQNDKLKKEIMILQTQLRKSQKIQLPQSKNTHSAFLHQQINSFNNIGLTKSREDILKKQNDFKNKQIVRISDLLKKICQFSEVYDFLELLQKQTKFKYILSSIGTSGYDASNKQKQQIQQSIIANQKKLTQIEKEIIRKMGQVLSVSQENEEIIKEYNKIEQIVERRLIPILNQKNEDTNVNSLSQIISLFTNTIIKSDREQKQQLQKLATQSVDLRKRRQEFDQKQATYQNTINKLTKDNDLVRTNLRQIYEELLSIAFPDQNDSQRTFEEILEFISETIQSHQQLQNQNQTILKQNQVMKQQNQNIKTQSSKLKLQNQNYKLELNKKRQFEETENQKNALAIDRMKEEISNLKDNVNAYQQTRQDLEQQLKRLQSSKKQIMEDNNRLKNDLSKFRKQMASKHQQIHQYAQNFHKLQEVKLNLAEQNQKLHTQVDENRSQINKINNQRTRILQQKKSIESKLIEYQRKFSELQKNDNNQLKLKNQLQKATSLNQELNDRFSLLQKQLKYRQLKIEGLNKEIKTLSNTLMKKQQDNIQLEMKLEKNVTEFDDKFNNMILEINQLKTNNQLMENTINGLQQQKNDIIQHYENMIIMNKKQFDQILVKQQEHYTQIQRIQQSQHHILINQLNLPRVENSPHLQNNSQPDKKTYDDEIISKSNLEQLQEMNQISQIKSNELNQIKELLEQRNIQYDGLVDNYRELQIQIEEKNAIAYILQNSNAQYKEKINSLKLQLTKCQQINQDLTNQINRISLQSKEKQVAHSENQQKIQQIIKHYQQKMNQYEQKIISQNQQLQIRKTQYESNYQKIQYLENEINQLQQNNNILFNQRNQLLNKCNIIDQQLKKRQKQQEQLQKNKDISDLQLQQLSQKINQLQFQNEKLIEQTNSLEKQINLRNSQLMKSHNNKEELNKQLEQLESNFQIVLNANKQYEIFVLQNTNNNEKEKLKTQINQQILSLEEKERIIQNLIARQEQYKLNMQKNINQLKQMQKTIEQKTFEASKMQQQIQLLQEQDSLNEQNDNKQNQRLKQYIEQLQSHLNNDDKLKQYEVTISQQKQIIQSLENQLKQHKNDLDNELQTHHQNIQQQQSQINKLNAQIQQYLQQIHQLSQNLNDQIQNKTIITNQHLTIEQNHKKERENFIQQVEKLKQELAIYEQLKETNNANLQNMKNENEKINTKYQQIIIAYNDLVQINQNNQKRIQQLEELITDRQSALTHMRNDFIEIQAQMNTKIKDNRINSEEDQNSQQSNKQLQILQRIASLQNLLELGNRDISLLENKNKELSEQNQQIKNLLDQNNQELTQYNQKLVLISRLRQQLEIKNNILQEQKEDYQTVISNLNHQLTQTQSKINSIKKQSDAYVQQISSKNNQIKQLNETINNLQIKAKEDNENNNQRTQKIQDLQIIIDLLKQNCNELKADNSKIHLQSAAIVNQMQKIKQKLQNQIEMKIRQKQQQLQQTNSIISTLKVQISTLQTENYDYKTNLIELQKTIQLTNQHNDNFKKQINVLEKLLHDKQQQLKNISTLNINTQELYITLNQLEQQVAFLKQTNQEQKLIQKELIQQLNSKQITENQQQVEIDYLKRQLFEKNVKNENIQKIIFEHQMKVNDLIYRQTSLQKQVSQLEQNNSELRKENINLKTKLQQITLVDIESYKYQLKINEININQLKNQLQQKAKEIISLRTQKEELLSGLQLKIAVKANQQYPESYQQFKFHYQHDTSQKKQTEQVEKILENQKNYNWEHIQIQTQQIVRIQKSNEMIESKHSKAKFQNKNQNNQSESFSKNSQTQNFANYSIQNNDSGLKIQQKEQNQSGNMKSSQIQHYISEIKCNNKRCSEYEDIKEMKKQLEYDVNKQYEQQFKQSGQSEVIQYKCNQFEEDTHKNVQNKGQIDLQKEDGVNTIIQVRINQVQSEESEQIDQIQKQQHNKQINSQKEEDINSVIKVRINQVQSEESEQNDQIQRQKNQNKQSEKENIEQIKIQKFFGSSKQEKNKEKILQGKVSKQNKDINQKKINQQKNDNYKNDNKGNDFDDFGDLASQKMGDSMISNKSEKQVKYQFPKQVHYVQSQQQITENVQQKKEQLHQNDNKGNDFDDFGDLASQKMGDSMIQNKSEKQVKYQFPKQVHYVQSQQQITENVQQKKEQLHQNDNKGNDFDDFGDLASQKMGDSMISNKSEKQVKYQFPKQVHYVQSQQQITENVQQKKEQLHQNDNKGNDFDDFGDLASQKMGDSMISNKSEKQVKYQFPKQVHYVQSQQQITENVQQKKEQLHQNDNKGNDFDDFGDLASQKMGDSMISNKSEKQVKYQFPKQVHYVQSQQQITENVQQKKEQLHQNDNKGNDFDDFGDLASQKMGDSMISNKSEKQVKYQFPKQVHYVQSQQQITENVQQKKEQLHQNDNKGNDFDDFGDLASQKMGDSMISNKSEKQVKYQFPKQVHYVQSQQQITENVQQKKEQLHQNDNKGNDFDDFGDLASQKMGDSMISNKSEKQVKYQFPKQVHYVQSQQQITENVQQKKEQLHQNDNKGNDFDDFGDLASQKMGDSMIQNKSEKQVKYQFPKQVHYVQSQQQITENVQQKKEQLHQNDNKGNDFDDFGDLASQKMGDSMISNKSEKQVKYQFPKQVHYVQSQQQITENVQQKKEQLHQNDNKGNDFDDFGDLASQKMGDSMISNKSEKQVKYQFPKQVHYVQSQQQITENVQQKKEQLHQNDNKGNDFDDFGDLASQKMGDSMISNKSEKQVKYQFPKQVHYVQSQQQITENVQQKKEQLHQNDNKGNDFDDFGDLASQKMGDSMISNKSEKQVKYQFPKQVHYVQSQQQITENVQQKKEQLHQNDNKGNDFDDFGDLASQKMGDSMISNKSEKQVKYQFPKQVHYVQSQQQITENVQQKKEQLHQNDNKGNDFDDFGDLASQKMGDSMISNKSEKQVKYQFPKQVHYVQSQQQITENVQQKKEQLHQNDNKGNDFDDFGDLASQKMGDSMISNQDQKPVPYLPNTQLQDLLNFNSSPQHKHNQIRSQNILPKDLFSFSDRAQIHTQLSQINELIKFIPSPRNLTSNQFDKDDYFKFSISEQQYLKSSKQSVQSVNSQTQNIFDNFQKDTQIKFDPKQQNEDLIHFQNPFKPDFDLNDNNSVDSNTNQQKKEPLKKEQLWDLL